jgi:heat shock protein HslJ
MYHRQVALLIALLLIGVNLAGCAQGTDVTVEVPTNTPAPAPTETLKLEGTLWKLDFYLNNQGKSLDVLTGSEITLEFEADQVVGSAGCNNYFATYKIEGNSLTINQIGSTMISCEPEVNEQEMRYVSTFKNVASYQVADERLEMLDADGEIVLTFAALEPTPLTGTTWRLSGYNNGKDGFASVLNGSEITAVFGADGSLSGSAGCNSYTASYTVQGNKLSLGSLAGTLMMCEEPAGIMDQENDYLAALAAAAAYQVKVDALEVFDADGARLATYSAAAKIALANPASVYCEEQGGSVDIRMQEGGEVGYCVLPNGSECEEWAFFRGECAIESAASLTQEALENAIYQSEWPADGLAQLSGGEYREPIVEGSATELVILLHDTVFGDLDGDGAPDAAVILITNPGGSGTFYELAAVLNQNGEPQHIASASLGDRAQIRAFSIQAGQITVEMVTHGPDDPLCCPTQIVRNTYALQGDALVELESQVLGVVEENKGALPPELLGVTWRWWGLVEIEPASQSLVPHPENYSLLLQPDGSLSIQADCNMASGSYNSAPEGKVLSIALGPATMAFCGEESLDQQFLDLFNSVNGYDIEDGRLVLNLQDGAGKLIFDKD